MNKLPTLKHKIFKTKSGEEISYYQGQPQEKKILLIHGNFSSASEWKELVAKLENKYELLVPDLRGFGDSSYNNPTSDLIDLAVDLKELVDEVAWNTFSVIGWSLGGGVSAEFAHLLPEKVEKLILTASMGLTGYPMFQITEEGFQFDKPLTTKEEIATSLYYLPGYTAAANKDVPTLEDAVKALFAKVEPTQDFLDHMTTSMMEQKHLLDMDYALLKYNISDQVNTSNFEGSGHYKDLTMPILILHGDKDMMVDQSLAKANKELLGDKAEIHIFEGAGHSLHLEVEEEWDQIVEEFIER